MFLSCHIRKTAPSPDIYETNIFTKFHDDWAKNVTSIVKWPPTPGSHVIQLTGTIFELNSCIKGTNVLTKFHDNWDKNVSSRRQNAPPTGGHIGQKNVASRVFTMKTAPPTGGHVFQRTRITFELHQHIIKTNILTKFHEDWASNVTSTVFTSFKLDRDIIGTKLLTKFHEHRKRNVPSRVFTNTC
ncbi:hypothetical protein DPMN_176982 [Dreissena polymorpha]|uniref:Uncharacterized protein n=1 Tax=Dreissena polymorpha TaxID=45954 RepID=A0A9D4ECE5_DREPO|nr:hypothetical protein DPMN_176982 [Dreissena polymorpha]